MKNSVFYFMTKNKKQKTKNKKQKRGNPFFMVLKKNEK